MPNWLQILAQHPARVLGLFFTFLGGFAFSNAGLFGDDTLFLERFVPTMQSWDETWNLPPRLRDWFGAMHRPLSFATWRLDLMLFGDDWRGHHWHHALWYGFSIASFVAMSSQVLRLLGPELRLSRHLQVLWSVGLLFAVHPMHVETAAWLATRHDVIYASLLCLAIAFAARAFLSTGPGLNKWAILAAIAGGLSVQAKESGYVWLPLIVLMALQVRWRGDLKCWTTGLKIVAPSLIVFVLCLVFRSSSGIEELRAWHPEAFKRWLSACGWAMDSTILPLAPRLFYLPPPPTASGLLALSMALVWFGVGWKRRRHDGLILFGLSFATATLAPTWMVSWQPLMETIVADRYLFLPIGGILLALSRLLSGRRLAVRMVTVSACLIWSAISAPYVLAWAEGGSKLGAHTVRYAPHSVEARIGALSRSLRVGDKSGAQEIAKFTPLPVMDEQRVGQWQRLEMVLAMVDSDWLASIRNAQEITKLKPKDASAFYDLGAMQWNYFLSLAHGSATNSAPTEYLYEARDSLVKAIEFDSRNFRSHLLLGHIAATLNEHELARQHFLQCVAFGGNSAEASEAKASLGLLPR